MAEKKKRRVIKKAETVRERADKKQVEPKQRRIRQTAGKVGVPIKAAARFGSREYYLPMPDNRVGRFLNKRRYVIPRFYREAWAELRQVVWPSRRETIKLTTAVILFALIFGALIWVTDMGIEKLFRKVILK